MKGEYKTMADPITKECEACGLEFTTTSLLKKYCDECGCNGLRVKKKYDRQIAINKRYQQIYKPEVFTKICAVCKTEFQTTYKNRIHCSSKCDKIASKQKLRCTYCRKKLQDTRSIDEIPDEELRKRHHFCNDDCKNKYELEKTEPKICQNCGKTYRNNNKKFCTKECQFDFLAKHGRKTEPKQKPTLIQPKPKTNMHICYICKKPCTKPYFRIVQKQDDKLLRSQPICSKECLDIHNKSLQRQKDKLQEQKLKDYIKCNGMCGICSTPYTDCERMQSEFRIIPKGAKYIDNKIQECPKFTTKFK